MKVDRKELRDILVALRPGLEKKELAQQTCHFIFMEDMIATYNGRILITHPYVSDAEFSVKGEEFFRLIDGMPDDIIALALEGNKIKLSAKSTSAALTVLSESENKIPKTIRTMTQQMSKWKPLPKDFREAIDLCAFSASADLTAARGMACVSVQGNICKSRDISRASMYRMKEEVKDHLLIWSREATELAKFDVVEYCTDGEKWAHFRTIDNATFSCQILRADHSPKLVEVLDSFNQYPHFELPSEMKSVIDSVFVLAHDILDLSGKFIAIRFEKGEIFVKADNDIGWVEKKLKCGYDGDSITVGINAKFMSQILERATQVAVHEGQLHFVSGPFQHLLAQAPRRENT